MTSTFDTEFAGTAWPLLESEFGETVTWTYADDTTASPTAVVEETNTETIETPDGRERIERIEVGVDPADVPQWSAEDTVTRAGLTYAITGVLQRAPILVVTAERRTIRRIGGNERRIGR